jgi:methionyl-tRNA formyltransferase
MGTPEFAVPSLEKLIQAGFNVVAVITAPDKPSGRGLQLTPSPVKLCALQHNIPLLQPEKLKDETFLAELKSYQADLQIVVAFRMLPESVWNMPKFGTFNLHASLLPQYRGAAPINWAIINGETETGVTTFFLQHEIDTGPIIFQEKEPIYPHDDAGALYKRLMHKGADLVIKTTKAIQEGNYPQIPQVLPAKINNAPKIFKETCQINFHQTAQSVINQIRGLSPYPAAWLNLKGKNYKVFQATISQNSLKEGEINTDNKTYLQIGTKDLAINIEEWQAEGKRKMRIEEFFKGNKI